jgi:hypothetical protein
MPIPLQADIRKFLKRCPDGASALQIADCLIRNSTTVRASLKHMPDVYIDRWVQMSEKTKYTAIWMVVEVPENCPHPKGEPDEH